MSEHSALIAQLLAAREHWVELAPGKAVKFRRPSDTQGVGVLAAAAEKRRKPHLFIEELTQYAVDWRGITEADLLGASVGNSDPLPFDSEVWGLVVADNLDWFGAAIAGLLSAINERLSSAAVTSGNSAATSTPSQSASKVATS